MKKLQIQLKRRLFTINYAELIRYQKKSFVLTCILSFALSTLFAQQWFVKDLSVSSASGYNAADFRPAGTFIHEYNPDGVLIYGTIGYFGGQLTPGNTAGAEGGHGKADIVISKNDFDGNNLWSFTFGSSNRDVVSHAILDKAGDVIISGYSEQDGIRTAFYAKVDVIDNGGSYSFNLLWQKEYGNWTPTDLFEIFHKNVSRGYVVIGTNGSSSYIIKSNLGGSTSITGYWAKKYNTRLYSGVQMKQKRNALPYPAPYFNNGKLIVCGAASGYGYIAHISLNNGNIIKDKAYTSWWATETITKVACEGDDYFVEEFNEIIQLADGDIALTGHTQNGMIIFRVEKTLQNPKWMVHFNEIDPQQQPQNRVFDLVETRLNLAVIFTTNDNNFNRIELDKNGNYQIRYILKHSPTVPLEISKQSLGIYDAPFMDFSVECQTSYHYSGRIYSNNNNNSSSDNITHLKSNPLTRNCGEITDNNIIWNLCTQFTEYFNDNVLLAQTTGALTVSNASIFNSFSRDLPELAGCQPAIPCTNTLCSPTTETHYVCGDDFQAGVLLSIPNPGAYLHFVWTTGEQTNKISVTKPGQYFAYAEDIYGCVHSFQYDVIQTPEIGLVVTPITPDCSNSTSGADLSFTTSVPIVSVNLVYPAIGGNYISENIAVSSIQSGTLSSMASQYSGIGGTYSLTVTDQYGCTESFSKNIAAPQPIAISYSSTSATPGNCDGSINITITGGTPPYSTDVIGPWYSGNHIFSNIFIGSLCPGCFYVTVTDANGCVATLPNCIPVDNGTKAAKMSKHTSNQLDPSTPENESIKLYPNPSEGIVHFQFEATQSGQVKVFDLQSRLILEKPFDETKVLQLDLNDQENGTYLIQINTKHQSITERVVILH